MCKILNDSTNLEREEGMLSDVCTNDENKLWKYAVVLFVFNDNMKEELKSFVRQAMRNISEVSIVKFIEIRCQTDLNHQIDYIEIIDKGEFASYVGRIGNRQV